MKVSVCMLAYNLEQFIAQAIDSVMMQETDFDYELVIGEDCSTDRTRDICIAYQKKYPDKIRLLLREKNIGVMHNIVQTLHACTGQFIALLDADDYWTSPHKLQKQADFLDTHLSYALCCAQTVCFYEDKSREPQYQPPLGYKKYTLTIEDVLSYSPIACCSTMFRNGLFDSFPDWYFSLGMYDWPIWIMCAQHGKAVYLPELMAAYRIHANSTYSSQGLIKRLLDDVDFYKAINVYLSFKYQPLIREMLAQRYEGLAAQYLLQKDIPNTRRYALESLKSMPLRKYFSKRGIIVIYSLVILAESLMFKRAIRRKGLQ
jgi:glycosyltransferase involved in cell wall biosynthesis